MTLLVDELLTDSHSCSHTGVGGLRDHSRRYASLVSLAEVVIDGRNEKPAVDAMTSVNRGLA